MKNLLKETWNFVFNTCEFHYTYNKDIFKVNKYQQPQPYELYSELQKRIKIYLNLSNLEDILDEHYKKTKYGQYDSIYSDVMAIYIDEDSVSKNIKLDYKYMALLLFNILLNSCKNLNKSEVINKYNSIIHNYGINYQNEKFLPITPVSDKIENKNYLLSLSQENQIKYKNIIDSYNDAYELYNQEKYSSVIHRSFSALESLIKVKLQEMKVFKNEDNSFSDNIHILSENNFFKQFKIESYFNSLGTIRNKHSGHGKSIPHYEDKNFSYFYLHNIGNCIVYIINN